MPDPQVLHDTNPVLYFVSDVHLGGSPPADELLKRERFLALLDRVRQDKASVCVLGDLFDFWFEYRWVVPRTALPILHRLDSLAREGTPVRFLAGNHDYWMADFLRKETAIEVLEDGATVAAQGRLVRLYHGDGRGPGDTGYKILKRILRHPIAIHLYRWVHPDLGIPLALRTSGVSRHYTSGERVDVEGLYRHVGQPALQRGVDAVLIGHYHVARHLRRPEGDMLFLGDWFRQYTCARLRGGILELVRWPLDEALPTE